MHKDVIAALLRHVFLAEQPADSARLGHQLLEPSLSERPLLAPEHERSGEDHGTGKTATSLRANSS